MSDAAHPNPELAWRLERIYSLHRKEIDLRLENSPYESLLHDLADPHLRLPPVVHVAGTNGKGSTLACLRALLEAAGRRVHVMTSPHLIRFNERIRLAGSLVDDSTLIQALDHVWTVNNGRPVTFFEFTTALTFHLFAGHDADFTLVETGMGGRLDCSNIIPDPVVTGIASIGYDHQRFLGETLPEISGEKAGIMKKNVPCVIGHQPYFDQVHYVFTKRAQELDIPLSMAGQDWGLDGVPQPNLYGVHQHWNAAMAVQLYNHLPDLPPVDLSVLGHVDWPGRMQKVDHLGQDIWIDGGHNEGGAKALARICQGWREESPDTPIHLVLGMGADKDPNAFLSPFMPYIDSVHCIDLHGGRNPQSAESLRDKIDFNNVKTIDISDINTLPGKKIICGSLYLYASIFAKN